MSSTLNFNVARAFAPLWKPSRYKGAHGGRGSGKSHGYAELLTGTCMMNPGTRAVCIREVQKSLKLSAKVLIEDKIRERGLSSFFTILESEIRTPGGGVIIFQGMQNHTADSIKSLEGFDIAWCEEAQSLSQKSLDLLRPTIRKAGSELWFSWNPFSPDDPVDVLLRGEFPPSNSTIVQMNFDDNPWLPDELKEEMIEDRRRDPEKAAHVWDGEYSHNSNSRVFNNWRVEAFDTPKSAVMRQGADWGFAVDPSVLIRCFVDGRKLYVDFEAWEVGCEIDKTPALFDKVPDSRKNMIRADSARPETVSFMKRAGFKIRSAIKGPGSIEDGIEFLRSFDIIVHPRCVHVAKELTLFSYKVDVHTDDILPALEDKNNHTIDALRYALEELRRSGYKASDKQPKERGRDGYWPVDDDDGNDWKTI